MSREDFDPNHPHGFMTRDGRNVRIITMTDGAEEYPIIGIIEGTAIPLAWTPHGRLLREQDSDGDIDLINAPAPKRRVCGWIAAGVGKGGRLYGEMFFRDREDARAYAERVKAGFGGVSPILIPIDHEIDGDPS